MSTQPTTSRALAVLRDCGPYVLIELLLPGGTLIALLLYLSRRFVRDGLGAVRQHAIRRIVDRVALKAKPHPGRARLCMCLGHTAVVSVASGGFAQRCDGRSTLAACCCA
jgi:hypothetical protein